MRLVVDTNVLVSGLLQAHGPSGQIVRWLATGTLSLCHDARILAEYHDVLRRPKFRFDPALVDHLLGYLEQRGEPIAAGPLTLHLDDPDDEPFLEVAVAAQVPYLVTGNSRHFPAKAGTVEIVTPRELVEILRK